MFKLNQLLNVTDNGERITVEVKEIAKDYLWVENINTERSFPINEWDMSIYNIEEVKQFEVYNVETDKNVFGFNNCSNYINNFHTPTNKVCSCCGLPKVMEYDMFQMPSASMKKKFLCINLECEKGQNDLENLY